MPRTAEIAPEAPTNGIVPAPLNRVNVNPANIPQTIYAIKKWKEPIAASTPKPAMARNTILPIR